MSVVSADRDTRPFLTVDELVRQLRLNEKTVRQMLQRGEIAGFKIGSLWRVDPADLDRWLLSQRQRPKS